MLVLKLVTTLVGFLSALCLAVLIVSNSRELANALAPVVSILGLLSLIVTAMLVTRSTEKQ